MSRYSPQILPDYGESLATAFVRAGVGYLQGKELKKQRDEQDRARDITDYTAGYRTNAPVEPQISGRAAMGDPAMQRAAIDMMGKLAVPKPAVPSGLPLANAIDAQGSGRAADVGGMTPPPTAGAAPAISELPEPTLTPTPPHPGAYDPATKSFTSAGVVDRARIPQRYVGLPHGGYLDTDATPRAEAARDRALQLQLAAAFRSQLENQREGGQSKLQDQKDNAAGGREKSRETAAGQRATTAANARVDAAGNQLVKVVGADGKTVWMRRAAAEGEEAPEPSDPLVKTEDDAGKVTYTPRSQASGKTAPATRTSGGGSMTQRARLITSLNSEIGTVQRQISTVNSTVNAATYAQEGSAEKKAASDALNSLTGLKTRLDGLIAQRDTMVARQRTELEGTKLPAAPAAGAKKDQPPVPRQPPVTQEEYDAARAAGWTDDKIEAKYGKLGTDIKRKP